MKNEKGEESKVKDQMYKTYCVIFYFSPFSVSGFLFKQN